LSPSSILPLREEVKKVKESQRFHVQILYIVQYSLPLYFILITHTMILGVFGGWQVLAIIGVALLLFGGKKIPELMKGLGRGVKEFKDATKPEEEKPAEEK